MKGGAKYEKQKNAAQTDAEKTALDKKIAAEKENVTFVKVDVDEALELAQLFGIQSIPTVAYIKNQKLALRELGFKPKDAILENIKTIFE